MYFNLMEIAKNINWNSPVIFIIFILMILFLYRKWKLFWFSTLTFSAAWLTNDLIIKNLLTSAEIIKIPDLVYIIGGIIIGLAALIGFTKFIIE